MIFFFAGHRYLKHERIQRFTIYNKYGAWNFAGVNLVNWRCECQHLGVLREQILTDWNLRNFAWKQFFRFPGSCSETSARKKIKLFKYVTFEPQVIQRGAMQRKWFADGFSSVSNTKYPFWRLVHKRSFHSFIHSLSFLSIFAGRNFSQNPQILKFERFFRCTIFYEDPFKIVIHSRLIDTSTHQSR